MRQKRKWMLCSILAVVLSINGCASNSDYVPPEGVARQQSQAIVESFAKRDSEAIEEMFSDHVKETHDLRAEIETAFAFIDGEIVSYDEPTGNQSTKKTREREGVVQMCLEGHIDNVKTSTDKVYAIYFHMEYIYVYDESYEGVSFIKVIEKDTYDENGESNNYIIGEVDNIP